MPTEEALTLLRSIDATLKDLLALSRRRVAGSNGHGKEVASDKDLDGKYGDPVIKAKDPRDWNGPTMKGRRFSQCPAEYLDLLAARFDFFAQKADENRETTDKGKPKSQYLRLDAARARGWAARIRAGKVTPETATEEWAGDTGESWATDEGGWDR